ncbi:glycohydrolase toxin TNT-related protein [Actinokineospora globicatena]|uniref:Uncharacterized protein n=1 Tax=Actinokineospora globicatena TaxID=103729 RepID=A0A9W6QS50_9PSEU|nr:glycohydrolase toxin TNT-related protein [Actinokineospora globicatena]GLW95145.1 hypothetical protein Aglo03_59610 [Actinokineospora globicatena]
MSITIPSEITWLFPIVVGESWPEGDEDKLRALADTWRTAGGDVDDVIAQAKSAASQAIGGMDGQAAEAFEKYWAQFVEGDEAYLTKLRAACDGLGESCDNCALEVEYAKYSIIAALVMLAIEIAALIAAAFGTFGASSAGIPIAQAATRITVQMIFRKLITAILREVLTEVAIDAAIQGLQMAKGDRKSWDLAKTGGAALSGAISGLVGGGMDFIPTRATGLPGRTAEGAFRGMAEGAGSTVINAAVTGQDLTAGDLLRAGVSGGVSGGIGGAKSHFDTPTAGPIPGLGDPPAGGPPVGGPPAGGPPAGGPPAGGPPAGGPPAGGPPAGGPPAGGSPAGGPPAGGPPAGGSPAGGPPAGGPHTPPSPTSTTPSGLAPPLPTTDPGPAGRPSSPPSALSDPTPGAPPPQSGSQPTPTNRPLPGGLGAPPLSSNTPTSGAPGNPLTGGLGGNPTSGAPNNLTGNPASPTPGSNPTGGQPPTGGPGGNPTSSAPGNPLTGGQSPTGGLGSNPTSSAPGNPLTGGQSPAGGLGGNPTGGQSPTGGPGGNPASGALGNLAGTPGGQPPAGGPGGNPTSGAPTGGQSPTGGLGGNPISGAPSNLTSGAPGNLANTLTGGQSPAGNPVTGAPGNLANSLTGGQTPAGGLGGNLATPLTGGQAPAGGSGGHPGNLVNSLTGDQPPAGGVAGNPASGVPGNVANTLTGSHSPAGDLTGSQNPAGGHPTAGPLGGQPLAGNTGQTPAGGPSAHPLAGNNLSGQPPVGGFGNQPGTGAPGDPRTGSPLAPPQGVNHPSNPDGLGTPSNYTSPGSAATLTPRHDQTTGQPPQSYAGGTPDPTGSPAQQQPRPDVHTGQPTPGRTPDPGAGYRPDPGHRADPGSRPDNTPARPDRTPRPEGPHGQDPASRPGTTSRPDTTGRPTGPDTSRGQTPAHRPDPGTRADQTARADRTDQPRGQDPTSRPDPNTRPDPTSRRDPNTQPDGSTHPDPHATTRPDPTARPDLNTRSDTTARPDPGTRPDGSTRPDPAPRPDATTRPDAGSRPDATRPDSHARPDTTRPDAGSRPDTTTRPDPHARPDTNPRPDTAARPDPNARPDGNTKPDADSRPDTTRPDQTHRPDVDSQPDPHARPDADSRPDPTHRPDQGDPNPDSPDRDGTPQDPHRHPESDQGDVDRSAPDISGNSDDGPAPDPDTSSDPGTSDDGPAPVASPTPGVDENGVPLTFLGTRQGEHAFADMGDYVPMGGDRSNGMGSYDQRVRPLISDHNPWGSHSDRDDFNQHHRPDGTYRTNQWPPHGGAVPGSQRDVTLPVGSVLDRFGGETGRYLSPMGEDGQPYHYRERAIFPDNAEVGYHVYVVMDPAGLRGEMADVAPALGQPGGGRQFTLPDTTSVEQLLDRGVIREVHAVPAPGVDSSALPEHLRPIADRNAFPTPAGAALFDPADARTRAAANAVTPIPGHFVLDVHSDGNAAVVDGQRLGGAELADLARASGWNGTDPIVLNACEAGRGPDGLGADLARHAGVPVIAPTERAWSGEQNTTPYSSSADYVDADGRVYPRIPPDGGWNSFSPTGDITPAGDGGLPVTDATTPRSTPDSTPPDLSRGLIQSDFTPPPVRNADGPTRIPVDDRATRDPADPHRPLRSDEPLIGRTGLDPNTAYQVDGRGTYYTDHRGVITHADLVSPNTRDDSNPDVNRPAPNTTYRVDVDGAEHRYTTDDRGFPPRYLEWSEPFTNNPNDPVRVPAPGAVPGDPLGPLGHREAFSDRTNLPPHTRFDVPGRGTFYTGAPDANGFGQVVAVEAVSSPGGPRDSANPDLNNFHPNTLYVLDGSFVIETNEHGVAGEATDERTYGPSRRETRNQWSQDIVAGVGGTGFDGGHIKPNQVTQPTPDAVGQFPQLTTQNQGRGTPNNRDTWYGQDMQVARDQRGGARVEWHDFQGDGGPTPHQVHTRFVLTDASGAPRIILRRYDNV